MPERAQDSQDTDRDSGPSSPESLASWDRDTLSWKTSALSLLGESTKFSARWPTSGMMRSGRLYPQPPWAPPTDASASSLWPTATVLAWATPKASDGQGGRTTETKGGGNAHIDRQARAWATPSARDHKDTGDLTGSAVRKDGTPRDDTVPRQALTWAGPTPFPFEAQTAQPGPSPAKPLRKMGLNPIFVEWLMGLPCGWTTPP